MTACGLRQLKTIYCQILVGGEEFESPTPWMSTKYSNQLN